MSIFVGFVVQFSASNNQNGKISFRCVHCYTLTHFAQNYSASKEPPSQNVTCVPLSILSGSPRNVLKFLILMGSFMYLFGILWILFFILFECLSDPGIQSNWSHCAVANYFKHSFKAFEEFQRRKLYFANKKKSILDKASANK